MPNQPETMTVEQVLGTETWSGREGGEMATDEVLFEGQRQTAKLHRPATEPAPVEGGEERGWLGEDKKGGLKFGRARERQQGQVQQTGLNGGGRREDATGRSIERQVSAKVAAEIFASQGTAFKKETFAQDFRFVTDAVHAAIVGTDDDIPFG